MKKALIVFPFLTECEEQKRVLEIAPKLYPDYEFRTSQRRLTEINKLAKYIELLDNVEHVFFMNGWQSDYMDNIINLVARHYGVTCETFLEREVN